MSGAAPVGGVVHVAFDACAAEQGSVAIVLLNLLRGWRQHEPDDRLTVLRPEHLDFAVPEGVDEVVLRNRFAGAGSALHDRTLGVRAACRDLAADALVSSSTASAFAGAPCPRGVIVYDLRHEVLPEQFSRPRQLARRASYAWSFRNADRLFCISQRTRDDLLTRRPRLAGKSVVTALGGDHVDDWPVPERRGRRYALAFGHFANKNAARVVAAWEVLCRSVHDIDLCLVGMSAADRAAASAQVERLGIRDRVELAPWLDDAEFRQRFTGASLVVFPSSFEGFGLPAVEAMRRRIPLVVSDDRALAEVTGGHAVRARQLTPEALSSAMQAALDADADVLDAAEAYAARFTWRTMAETVRSSLLSV